MHQRLQPFLGVATIRRECHGDQLSKEGSCQTPWAPEDARFRAYRSRDRRLQRDSGPRYWPCGRRAVCEALRPPQGQSTPTASDRRWTATQPMPAGGHPDAPTDQRYHYMQGATAYGYSTCRSYDTKSSHLRNHRLSLSISRSYQN